MADSPVPTPPPAPPAPSGSLRKKGLSPLAWVVIVIGSLLVLCAIGAVLLGVFIWRAGTRAIQEATGTTSFSELADRLHDDPARTVAETMVRLHPDLEAVETDEAGRTITVRDKRTGKVATLSFDDITDGRLDITTPDGEVSVDASGGEAGGVTLTGPESQTRIGGTARADDVPDWVPVYPEATDVRMAFQTSGDGVSGALTGQTGDPVDAVLAYYRGRFEEAGYAITGETMSRNGDGSFAMLSAQLGDEGRTLGVTAVQQPEATRIMLSYTEKTD